MASPLASAVTFFRSLRDFATAVAKDERIPQRDKAVVVALLALIASPIDVIPDWIPILGVLDDAVLLAVILDYFFNVLDQDILLSHWPWDMKRYVQVQRAARFVAALTPGWVKRSIWKYAPSPYKG